MRGGLAAAIGLIACCAGLTAQPRATGAAREARPGGWSTVVLSMERRAFTELVGLDPETPRSLLLVQAIRRLHDADTRDPDVRRRVVTALRASGTGATALPFPIDPATWCRDVRTRCSRTDVVADLLSDPRAGFGYIGLANLDSQTRAFVAASPRLLQFLARDRAGTLAAFGDAFRVFDGRVDTPGATGAASPWSAIVGAPVDRPEAFARNLFAAAGGRLAYFYDTVAHLDAAGRRFALGPGLESARAMADAFAAIPASWDVETRPFLRPPLDPASILLRVTVDQRGQPDGPRGRAFWSLALDPDGPPAGNAGGAILAGDDAGAAWLVQEVMGADSRRRLARLQAVLFAQRRLHSIEGLDASDAIEAVRAAMRMPALALSLERAGLADVPLLASLVRRGRGLSEIPASTDRAIVLAEWQGAVAIVTRLALAGSLERERCAGLLSSLAELDAAGGRFGDRVARWIDETLMPEIAASAALAGRPAGERERTVLAALAGVPADANPGRQARVTWESTAYVLDRASAELTRLSEVRARQEAPSLDDAMEAVAIANALGTRPADLRARVDALLDRLPARGHDDRGAGAVSRALDRVGRMIAAPGAPDARALGREREVLLRSAEHLLADVLTAIVYSCALGAPDDRVFLAGDVSARHDFGVERPGMPPGPSPPWALPAEQAAAGRPWHVQGSLIGLDVALARLRLRRLLGTMPTHRSLVNAAERSTLVLSMMLTPDHIDDGDTRGVVESMERGRRRVRSADDADRRALCSDAGLCGWRGELVAWARDEEPAAALASVTRSELARAGAAAPLPDAWGTASTVDGALAVRFPPRVPFETIGGRPTLGHGLTVLADLKLRLAELLAERGLPASLARDLGTAALQDFLDEVQPAYPDDQLAFTLEADRLAAERADDYLSALTVPGGPLVPIEGAP